MGRSPNQSANPSDDRRWPFWPVVPIYPYGQRRTLRREVVPDTVWVFEQVQGIFYVIVPVRMTVVRLQKGLLVYSPVAPTAECMTLLRELEQRYGPVRHIILSTVTGIEHKAFVGPFARRCPQAQVHVTPNQWSYPLNLPLPWLGLPRQRTRLLPVESSQAPFADEVDYALLGPINLGLGPFGETACFHRASRTLLVTDALVSIPAEPPPVLMADPYPLLFHAKDHPADPITDTPANRRKGWQRIVLFGFYFRPASLDVAKTGEMFAEARQSPDRSRRNYFGLYPFRWQPSWETAFAHLRQEGRVFVAPVLQTLIFNRGIAAVAQWAQDLASWQFERIIPAHLDAPVAAGPEAVRQAFAVVTAPSTNSLPAADLNLLRTIDQGLLKLKLTVPPNSTAPPPSQS